MGLAERQKALAQLYADTRLRERFLADPLAVCRELGFDDEESRRIAAIPPARLTSFARTLHNKRLAEVTKLLPLTSRVLGRAFNEAFERYAETHLSGGTKKHLGDALAFAAHLQKVLRKEKHQPRWVLDLLGYEKARVRAADPRRRVVVRYFRYDIRLLVRSVARREETTALAQRCVAIWARLKRGQPIRYALFVLPRRKK